MTSPYVKYWFIENDGITLTASPTAAPATTEPTASTIPAASYPSPAGNVTGSIYKSVRHIDSARLMPIALTLMRTSDAPGANTSVSTNSKTSGPPAVVNWITRDMRTSRSETERRNEGPA